MSNLDKRRREVELAQVKAYRMGMELKVEEKLEEIQRLKHEIEISLKKEIDLDKKING